LSRQWRLASGERGAIDLASLGGLHRDA
jgi:hypothetical protein